MSSDFEAWKATLYGGDVDDSAMAAAGAADIEAHRDAILEKSSREPGINTLAAVHLAVNYSSSDIIKAYRFRAALGATTHETPEGIQYVLIRGLHAMGFAQPVLESVALIEAALAAADSASLPAGELK